MPTLNVLDISHHNTLVGSAPFAALKSAGVLGVIHKATEGTANIDRECASRRTACIKAGLLWGTYHFFHAGNVAKQLDHYLTVTQPDANTLLALDHEADATLDEVRAFLQGIIDRTGRKAVIYSGHLLKEQLRKPDRFLSSHRLWLAQYGPRAVCPPGWTTPWLWQFAESGAVPGLSGEVDHDYYAGTADQLAREWAEAAASPAVSSAPKPPPDTPAPKPAPAQPAPVSGGLFAALARTLFARKA